MKTTNKLILASTAMIITIALMGGCALQIDENNERVQAMNNQTSMQSGYASVNGLEMYYEIHGIGEPLVLLHGAFSATGTSFGMLIPTLAQTRQVISLEMQGHGHTADIDRPLRIDQMAEDTVAALHQIGIEKADFFGYSMGAGIAMQIAAVHPEMVRKLIVTSVSFNSEGMHPGLIEGMAFLEPSMLMGSPWQLEYAEIAPNPDDFANLVAKVKDFNLNAIPNWTAEDVQRIKAPTLIIIGDSDIIRPEHAVELFRLLGGGVPGDSAGMPNSQLAILPGTSHVTIVTRADLLLPIIPAFLDRPVTEAQ